MDKKHHFRRQYRFTSVTLDRRRRVSTSEIAKKVKSTEGVVTINVADLNFWGEFPLQMIPVPKKKGHIKSCLKDPEDTAKFLKRKSRTIASMEQVYTNTETRVKIKEGGNSFLFLNNFAHFYTGTLTIK